MNERKLWAALNRLIGHRWHAQRLEDKLALGVPDLIYAINGVQGAIELKVVNRTTNKIRVSPYQRSWLMKHGTKGGRSFLMVWAHEDEVVCLYDHEAAYKIETMEDEEPVMKWKGQIKDMRDEFIKAIS